MKDLGEKKKSILVVDDIPFTRNSLKELINKTDYAEVLAEASNGVDAINLYKELKPDLVIMDILMSDMGGIVAIEEIIKNDRKAVILAVSGLDKSNLIELAHKKGAKAFIKKPYKIDSLLKKIKELLTNSEI
ncbi:hypothetical protein LCGC14_0804340 [marine sediment metagenome]|uniref:Response regulatory domain-containing protein n=1 Tax=marine sediment metagenome TaxID=412755 RepID=A0A0F9SW01_9ZZZZ